MLSVSANFNVIIVLAFLILSFPSSITVYMRSFAFLYAHIGNHINIEIKKKL